MKIVALFFLCIFSCVQSLAFFSLINQEWDNFKLAYGKTYHNAYEEYKRMRLYVENSEKILQHNRLHALGLIPFKLQMNQFGDIRVNEFALTWNGLRTKYFSNVRNFAEAGINFIQPANVELPDHVDWRTLGAVTEVKDQRRCASCWSFASTGALEGQHFRKTNKLINLSEQNLIDCSTSFGNKGCRGGLMTNAYNYIKSNKGIDTENSYPYLAEDLKCAYRANYSGATDRGYAVIERGNEEALKAAVATIGPISVGIDASHRSFQFYKEGIYEDASCRNGSLDHAVLVVGYGTTEKGADYWIVKNSWGLMWGIDGYILMARNKDNHCGIATLASYPLV